MFDIAIAQALQSTKREHLENLAKWYASTGESWSSCLLYSNLAFKCRGVELFDKLNYMRSCLSVLEEHVLPTHPGATKLKALVITRLQIRTPDKAESDLMLERMLAWARDKDNLAPPRILMVAGATLVHCFPSQYVFNGTKNTCSNGGDMMLAAGAAIAQSVEKLGALAQTTGDTRCSRK